MTGYLLLLTSFFDMNRLGHLPLAVVLLALCCAKPANILAQNISTVSPFIQSGGVGPVTENSPIELRGILAASGGSLFGLFDPVKRQGGWVKLNEPGHDFTVRSYDPANDAVTVEYQGRVLSLALKTAKIDSMPAMAPIAAMPPRAMSGPPPMQGAPPTVEEAKRLEAVASEVARRRQQRQAAMMRQQAAMQAAQQAARQQPGVQSGNGVGGN